MYTALLTVENILGAHHDVWTVNVEADYHEERQASSPAPTGGTGRDAPVLPRAAVAAARATLTRSEPAPDAEPAA